MTAAVPVNDGRISFTGIGGKASSLELFDGELRSGSLVAGALNGADPNCGLEIECRP